MAHENEERPRLPPPPFWRTPYFEREVVNKADRKHLTAQDIIATLEHPLTVERQPDGRFRYWGWVPRLHRGLRVIVLPDGETVHNAFLDRRFKP